MRASRANPGTGAHTVRGAAFWKDRNVRRVAQSRAIPEGPLTRYEIQRTTSGREEVFMMGTLIGEGGDNPDAA